MSKYLKITGDAIQEHGKHAENLLKNRGFVVEELSPYKVFIEQEVQNELFNMDLADYPELVDMTNEKFDEVVKNVTESMYTNSLVYQAITEYVIEHIKQYASENNK